jgi:Relaxase/Mobilisation nuclease domain
MISKHIKGKCFRGVLDYLHEKKHSLIIGGNMAGDSPRILSAEFFLAKELNPKLKKIVSHSSLSLPKTERLDNDTWNAIANDYLKGMGFSGCQYVVYRHGDRDHDHIHIVASRIRITDGTTVNDSWDFVRSMKLVRELEIKYQLTPTLSVNHKLQRGQTPGELRQILRTGERSIRIKLQQTIDEETEHPITMPELVNHLKKRGVDVQVSLTQTGQIRGISYQLEGIAMSGTHLGQAYTFPGLQKHKQISYDHDRDQKPLLEAVHKKIFKVSSLEAAQQQKQRSLIIAPILRNLVNQAKNNNPETKRYRVAWQKDIQTLSLYRKDNDKNHDLLILLVKYQDQKFEPLEIPSSEENKPLIKQSDIDYWHRLSIKLSESAKLSQTNTKLKYAFKI